MAFAVVAHDLLTVAAAVLAALVAISGLLAALGRPPPTRFIDRSITLALLAIVGAALTGVLPFIGGMGPGDALHAVYAAVAVLALPLARLLPEPEPGELARAGRSIGRRGGRWLAFGGLATLGALLRLAGTG